MLAREKEVEPLGSDPDDMKHLSPEGITRAVDTLKCFYNAT